ncbi:Transcription factor [Arachis hypogaea]|nr:Transcription factor [Arachis hypogaea]
MLRPSVGTEDRGWTSLHVCARKGDLKLVIQIIRKRNGNLKQDGDAIELDIEAVDTETL